MTIRVMTWNLWWRFGPWEERQRAITEVVRAEEPDVLLAQEVWSDGERSSAGLLAAELGYHLALTDDPFGGREIGFHNAIVSRWPLADEESHALPNAERVPGHRRALVATAATPWGRWQFVSTHFDYRFDQSAVRVAQVDELLGLVERRRGDPDADLPMIVGGDLNAVPDSDEIRRLTGRSPAPISNLVLSDAWEHVGEGAGLTWRSDNPYQGGSAWPDRRLDYVLVSWPRPKPIGNPVTARLAGVDAVDGVVPSDHAAVVVELTTPDVAVPAGPAGADG